MSTIETILSFTKRYPVIGGSILIAGGLLMIQDSIDNAKKFHETEHARELSAQVVSVSEATLFPPRFDVAVSWKENGSDTGSTIRVGPQLASELQESNSAPILIGQGGGSVIFASQRQTEHPIEMAGIEAMPLIFVGILMGMFGVIIAMFGKRIL